MKAEDGDLCAICGNQAIERSSKGNIGLCQAHYNSWIAFLAATGYHHDSYRVWLNRIRGSRFQSTNEE